MNKIFIIAEQETGASLKRAFTYLDTLKKILIARYVLSPNIEEAISVVQIDATRKIFSTKDISLLFIIHDLEEKTERLISDIRFGIKGDHLAGVPIILLSTQSGEDIKDPVNSLKWSLIHLIELGLFIEIPFNLYKLEDILQRGVYLRGHLLSDVQKSFCLSALIGQYHHDLRSEENNSRAVVVKIEQAVSAKYGENSELMTIVSKLNPEKDINQLRDGIVALKKKIEEIEVSEQKDGRGT